MAPDSLQIVFDRFPQSARGKYQLTVGKQYQAQVKNPDLRLYSLVDDAGTAFNVSTFGQGYDNRGNWHICKGEGCEYNTCDTYEYEERD